MWNYADRFRWRSKERTEIHTSGQCIKRLNNKFFFNRDNAEQIVTSHIRQFPDIQKDIIERANNIIEHRFNLLGKENIQWSGKKEIKWNYDQISGKEYQAEWWQDIDYYDNKKYGDPKFIWELNRHQHFIILGKAFNITGDNKYRDTFYRHLDSWVTQNRPKNGINWTSSLEIAFRSIAWIWSYYLFDLNSDNSSYDISEITRNLILNGEHIAHNLSLYHSPNTHLTGEALGLMYIGLALQEYEKSDKWVRLGRKILLEQIPIHILADGGYLERSIWYHRYTLDIYIHFYLLSKLHNIEIPQSLVTAIEALADFLIYASKPDRSIPLMGDDDGGRLLTLDHLKGSDLRGILSTISVILERGDAKCLSGGYQEETLFLLGSDSLKQYEELESRRPQFTSRGYLQTGYYFMRSDWSKNANYMAYDCGPHGWLNCGHAHADFLSFQISKGDQIIAIDPGTYTYSGECRDYFRGAESHSLLIVDESYPAIASGPFAWHSIPKQKLLKWETSDNYDYVSGYLDASGHWKHVREVVYLKPNIFVFYDHVIGSGMHDISIRLHLEDLKWVIYEENNICTDEKESCAIKFIKRNNLELSLIDAWMSQTYGDINRSKMLIMSAISELPCEFIYYVDLDYAKRKSDISMKEIQDAFTLIRGNWVENILAHI